MKLLNIKKIAFSSALVMCTILAPKVAMASDCPTPVLTSISFVANCAISSSGLTIASTGTLAASNFYNITDTSSSAFLINNGTLDLNSVYAIKLNSSTLSQLTNNNTLNVNGNPYGILLNSGSTINNFNNYGTINGSTTNYPIWLNGGNITNFLNAGNISASGYGMRFTDGVIGTLTNTGAITATYAGILWDGALSIGTLNNLQGAGSSPLTINTSGSLPANYNIIINSTTNYGQLSVNNFSGSMNFDISGTSLSVANNFTYSDVLQGFSSLTGINYSGSFGGYTYSLFEDGANTGNWNLVFGSGGGGVAPEMNASLIPQVGLMLGCLFFLMGRKKVNTEPMLTA